MGGGDRQEGLSRGVEFRRQVCNVMSNSEHFHSNIDSWEYRIKYPSNCDFSDAV